MKSIYGDDKHSTTDSFHLKNEPTFLAEAPDYEEGSIRGEDDEYEQEDEAGDIMYASGKYRRGNSRNNQYGRPLQTSINAGKFQPQLEIGGTNKKHSILELEARILSPNRVRRPGVEFVNL